jgi:hypothetical protein
LNHEPLDLVPLWVLFLAVCVLSWLAIEGGYRFGKWRHARAAEEKEAPVGAMVASILALLAFMLDFPFGLASNRFEARRQVVLEEANAIGTTYLRTRLLPEPERTEAARFLQEYVDVRIRGVQERYVVEAIARSEKLQESIWSQAVKASENKNANAIMTGLFIQSLNEMIDVHAKRVLVGARSRIPFSIWGVFLLSRFSVWLPRVIRRVCRRRGGRRRWWEWFSPLQVSFSLSPIWTAGTKDCSR